MNNHELYHHGIKGQKWGVRRYQNKDGTRTSAGKRRAAIQRASTMSDAELLRAVERGRLEKQYKELSTNRNSSRLRDLVKQGSAVSKEIGSITGNEKVNRVTKNINKVVDNGDKINRYVQGKKAPTGKHLSDAELRQAVNRMNLERQYYELEAPKIDKGHRYVMEALEMTGATIAVAGTTYEALKKTGVTTKIANEVAWRRLRPHI